jgi:hypothetical protein
VHCSLWPTTRAVERHVYRIVSFQERVCLPQTVKYRKSYTVPSATATYPSWICEDARSHCCARLGAAPAILKSTSLASKRRVACLVWCSVAYDRVFVNSRAGVCVHASGVDVKHIISSFLHVRPSNKASSTAF